MVKLKDMCTITEAIQKIVDLIPDDTDMGLSLSDLKEVHEERVKYRLKNGDYAFSECLFDHPYISIALTSIPDKGTLPAHVHLNQQELLVILKGVLQIKIGDEITEYREGQFGVIQNKEKHEATAVGDTTFVVLVIPRDNGFPRR